MSAAKPSDLAASAPASYGSQKAWLAIFAPESSYRDRTELLEDFSSIYRVRSQIVHTGKHRLSSEERRLFLKLRWMCLRAMAKELELLKGDHQ